MTGHLHHLSIEQQQCGPRSSLEPNDWVTLGPTKKRRPDAIIGALVGDMV